MTTELDLLHVLKNRNNYDRYAKYVAEHAVTKQTLLIIKDMEEFFTINTTVTDVDWSSFSSWFKLVKHAGLKKAEAEIYDKIFTNLQAHTGGVVSEEITKHFVKLDYAGRIQDHTSKLISGQSLELTDIQPILDEYVHVNGTTSSLDDHFSSHDLSKILDVSVRSGGLDWGLEDLNVAIGPIRKGDFIIVGTRPEVGKTSFAVDQTCYMAQQLAPESTVLWFNNEEDGEKIGLRAYQSVLNEDLRYILANEKDATAKYIARMGRVDKVKVWDKPHMTVKEVEAVCKKYNPSIIVFNVLWKIHGFEGGSDVERLHKLFQWGRELAKTYGPVFALTQADGSAEGQQWVYQNQLYGSKTGIQGEADAIITIGAVHDAAKVNERYIHVPKNKLPGGPRSNSAMRHGFFEVSFDTERCRFISKTHGARK